MTVDELAQEIRRVDGDSEHRLGAGALAEALMPFLSRPSAIVEEPMALALNLNPLGVGAKARAPNGLGRGTIADLDQSGKAFVDYPAGGGGWWPVSELQPWDNWRDTLGRAVRIAWVKWAEKQSAPKPSWLVDYDDLPEADKEADRQIGEAIYAIASPQPHTGRAGVTDEMVRTACNAYGPHSTHDANETAMRAALNAALTVEPEGGIDEQALAVAAGRVPSEMPIGISGARGMARNIITTYLAERAKVAP